MDCIFLVFLFVFLWCYVYIPPHICLWTYFRWRREGKQSAQELESASRRPTAVPTTSVVGVRPPRKFSTTPVFSFHWDLLRLWKTVAELWYNSIWHRFWNPILVNIIGDWRWQLDYKSEYLLFSSYRQAAWSERMTSRLSILFICCHFLRWKPLLCQIPIDRLVCNALEWHWRSVLVERRHFANWPTKQATSCHILGCLFLSGPSSRWGSGGCEEDAKALHQGRGKEMSLSCDLGHYYKLSKSDPNAVFCSQMLFWEALVAVKQMQKLCIRENFKASSNISLTKACTCPLLNLARKFLKTFLHNMTSFHISEHFYGDQWDLKFASFSRNTSEVLFQLSIFN